MRNSQVGTIKIKPMKTRLGYELSPIIVAKAKYALGILKECPDSDESCCLSYWFITIDEILQSHKKRISKKKIKEAQNASYLIQKDRMDWIKYVDNIYLNGGRELSIMQLHHLVDPRNFEPF